MSVRVSSPPIIFFLFLFAFFFEISQYIYGPMLHIFHVF